MRRSWIIAALPLVFATSAFAQEPAPAPPAASEEAGCEPEAFDLLATDLSTWGAPVDSAAAAAPTAAEERVREIVAQPGVHVVHFWAPWCANSVAELRRGWYELIERNADVSFTFVTVWNDGASGAAAMKKYAIPARVVELTQPDLGPSEDKSKRRHRFMGMPLTWVPATWIFHQNGALAYALNAGEMEMATLQLLIDAAKKDWTRD